MAAERSALVLGGGGITGIAWETGLLFGLQQAGLDLTTADVVVGTSAGSIVGAQVRSGMPLSELYAVQLRDQKGEIAARMGLVAMARFVLAAAWPGDPKAGRARIGRAAIRRRTVPEAQRRAVIAGRLPDASWPERALIVTAVDALTGELRIFDRESGASLVDAVAASCAVPLVWPPMTVGGRRYVDGGVRSVANADLATGCDRVVVLAPVDYAMRKEQRITTQLASLGAHVRSIVVTPDANARKVMGSNSLDPSRRAASARAGHAQAPSAASAMAEVWPSGLPSRTPSV
jgi:NTE family protein